MSLLKATEVSYGVFNYIKENLPKMIDAINEENANEVVPQIHTYQMANINDDTVDSCMTLHFNGANYIGKQWGTEGVELEFIMSIDFQSNDIKKSTAKALKYTDAAQNMFFNDSTLGGIVEMSDMIRCSMNPATNYGWIDMTFKVQYELQ